VKIGTTDPLHKAAEHLQVSQKSALGRPYNFLTGVNDVTFRPYMCRKDLQSFENDKRFGKTWVLRHGEHHLQTSFTHYITF
jgi:hypothetical protein